MEKFIIRGGKPLCGTVKISGAKNAALPIMAASILADSPVTLANIPRLSDIAAMSDILSCLGVGVLAVGDHSLQIDASALRRTNIPYELTGRLRGSFLVMGPLLAKAGRAGISLPGGCAIGARPIDLHIKGLTALGAKFKFSKGSVLATADKLSGAKIYLDFPSVGATENILSAATLAEGETIIENAAAEPEIVDLANFLQKMGAKISGAGTSRIHITGVSKLQGTEHRVIPDRIEAGTWLLLSAATGGNLTVMDVSPDSLKPITAKLCEMNIPIETGKNSICVEPVSSFRSVDVKTLPFPGFPTDMQAPMTALLSLAEGTGLVTETVFENRFMHVGELARMGASIKVAGRSAVVEGKKRLAGAKVKATDLRAGAALLIAALSARGDTEIADIYHIDRGYEAIDEKLRALGAEIHRETD